MPLHNADIAAIFDEIAAPAPIRRHEADRCIFQKYHKDKNMDGEEMPTRRFLIFNKAAQPMRVYAVLRFGSARQRAQQHGFINAQQLRHIATESPCEYWKN